jgi:hypothetical protein
LRSILSAFCWIAISCSQSNISTDSVTVSGRFIGFLPIESTAIKLVVPNLITENVDEYEAFPEKDGTFTFTVPLLCPSYANLLIDREVTSVCIFISR